MLVPESTGIEGLGRGPRGPGPRRHRPGPWRRHHGRRPWAYRGPVYWPQQLIYDVGPEYEACMPERYLAPAERALVLGQGWHVREYAVPTAGGSMMERYYCPPAGLSDLSGREFWIVDEENTTITEDSAMIRSACPPIILSPGYKVVAHGAAPGQYRTGEGIRPIGPVGYRPGFLSPPGMPSMAGMGDLGSFSVMGPGGELIAVFSCRPFYANPELAVTVSAGGFRTLIQQGASEFPEGTTRPLTRALHTVRR